MVSTHHISIEAITACVPNKVINNIDLPFSKEALKKILDNTGIEQRRVVDNATTASDLCLAAAKDIIENQALDLREIKVLVYVTQYPDHILPASVHQLKYKLGLDLSCIAMQINEGCAGYGYGLQLASSLLSNVSAGGYALLLVGDTTSKVIREDDQATRPLFGDAGTATLLIAQHDSLINIEVGSDGSAYKDIMIPAGYRDADASEYLHMDGMNVFMFGISRVPKYLTEFLVQINQVANDFDYVILHQANKMMNGRIVRKLGIDVEKALYSLEEFGNTSNASVPLTIVHNLNKLIDFPTSFLCCGFGVGLSWASFTFNLDHNVYLNLIEYSSDY